MWHAKHNVTNVRAFAEMALIMTPTLASRRLRRDSRKRSWKRSVVFGNKFNNKIHVLCAVYSSQFNWLWFGLMCVCACVRACASQYGHFPISHITLCTGKSVESRIFARIGIVYRCGQLCMYSVYKAVQLKSKLHHVVTWSAAARPSRRLCYSPTVFFHHYRLTAHSFLQEKIRGLFHKYFFFFLLFFLNYASLKLHNFKFFKLVCYVTLRYVTFVVACSCFNPAEMFKMEIWTNVGRNAGSVWCLGLLLRDE